jgi:hypothetical protein
MNSPICQRCGAPISAAASFCRGCGNPLASSSPDPPTTSPRIPPRQPLARAAKPAEPSAPRSRRGTWTAVAVLVLVAAAGGSAAAYFVVATDKTERPDAYTARGVSSGTQAHSTTVQTNRPGTVRYDRGAYQVTLPSDWKPEDVEADHGSYVESTWHPPGTHQVTILVDDTRPYSGTAEDGARNVRQHFDNVTAYQEISFGPASVGPQDGWRWEFWLRNLHKVDWFIASCQTGVALLGEAPTSTYDNYASTFEEAAASLRPTCE